MTESRPGAAGEPRDLDVVVAGAIGVDTNVYLAGADIDFQVEANFTWNADNVGQAGGYSSKAFAALGCRTAFTGSVGRDALGEWIRAELAAHGIEALLFDDPLGTHRSVNFMYADGRRKNFYDGKGQLDVRPDLAACAALLGRARLVHLHLENWCRALPPLARERGVVVSCDLQDVVRLDDPYRADFIAGSDIIFFSTVSVPDPEAAVRHLLGADARRIVVGGMGREGAMLGSAAGIRHFPAIAAGAPVVDTNGAGDALAAGFLDAFVFRGLAPEVALLRGQLAARFACTRRAGEKRLITAAELDALAEAFAP